MALATLGLAMAQPGTQIDRDRLRLVLPMLSPRQREVAMHMLDGHSIRAIADDLGLAETTVCTYRRRIRQVLGKLVSSKHTPK